MKNLLAAACSLAMLMSSANVFAVPNNCQFTIEGNDQMQYNKKELKVPADCKEVEIELKHTGKLPVAAMGHNWVLTETKNIDKVVAAGIKAGQGKGYVDASQAEVLGHVDLIGGGQSKKATFKTDKLKKGGAYSYVCTFPGHSSMMRGKFIF